MIRVLVYNEFFHERIPTERAKDVYPDGIHKCIADFLGAEEDITVKCVTLLDPSKS